MKRADPLLGAIQAGLRQGFGKPKLSQQEAEVQRHLRFYKRRVRNAVFYRFHDPSGNVCVVMECRGKTSVVTIRPDGSYAPVRYLISSDAVPELASKLIGVE